MSREFTCHQRYQPDKVETDGKGRDGERRKDAEAAAAHQPQRGDQDVKEVVVDEVLLLPGWIEQVTRRQARRFDQPGDGFVFGPIAHSGRDQPPWRAHLN